MLHRPMVPTLSRLPKVSSDENAAPVTSKSFLPLAALPKRAALGDIANTFRSTTSTLAPKATVKPEISASSRVKLYEAPSSRPSTSLSTIIDIDAKETDEFHVAEYAADIAKYLFEKEVRDAGVSTYLASQPDLSEKMRATVVDWLVEVALKLRCSTEAFFLCVRFMDRYLAARSCSRRQVQLVGMVALLLASKIEDIYAPEIKDLVYLSDNAYTEKDVVHMEQQMLMALQWNMTNPTAYSFITRFCKAGQCTDSVFRTNVQYLMELALVDYKMIKYLPSMVCASAVLLTQRITGKGTWTPTLTHYTNYTELSLKDCVRDLTELRVKASTAITPAVFKKFSSSKFEKVALTPFQQ